jgi:TIR domain-containing protein
MADIFVSYSKLDRVLALKLSSWLEEQGWTTWRDKTVIADDMRDEVLAQLSQARVVIVLWSAASVGSPHILHEAITARDAGKLLHVKVTGFDRRRIPLSIADQAVLDADDLGSIGRAVASVLGGTSAARQLEAGAVPSVVIAGPPRDLRAGPVITRRTRETAQEAVELRATLNRTQQRRGVLLAAGSACFVAFVAIVLYKDALTDAVSVAQSGMIKLLALLNWNSG